MNDDDDLCNEKNKSFSDQEQETVEINLQIEKKASGLSDGDEPETPVLR